MNMKVLVRKREDVGKDGQRRRLPDNECDAVGAGLLIMYSVCDLHHINELNGGLVGEGIDLSGAGMQRVSSPHPPSFPSSFPPLLPCF